MDIASWLTPERIASVTFVVVLLMAALFSGARGWWYFKASYTNMEAQYKDRLAEKDKQIKDSETRAVRWEGIALKALSVGEKVVEKVEKIVVKNGG